MLLKLLLWIIYNNDFIAFVRVPVWEDVLKISYTVNISTLSYRYYISFHCVKPFLYRNQTPFFLFFFDKTLVSISKYLEYFGLKPIHLTSIMFKVFKIFDFISSYVSLIDAESCMRSFWNSILLIVRHGLRYDDSALELNVWWIYLAFYLVFYITHLPD